MRECGAWRNVPGMSAPPPDTAGKPLPDKARRLSATTVVVFVVCSLIELVLQAADYGLLEQARLRNLAYEFGGFWPGLLGNWAPNYTAQPITMFFTYSFLHGGLLHLIVNMIALVSLGEEAAWRVGSLRYALIYTGSILGGAIAFALLSTGLRPMVGASGALFGLAGAIIGWDIQDRFRARLPLWSVLRIVGFLIVLNAVMFWSLNGQLAWETHLGGFVAGLALAFVFRSREGVVPLDDAGPR